MSPCVLWPGARTRDGYGNAGRGKYAHIEAFKDAGGVIPDGMEIDHLCHVRLCVNVAHLEAVTHAENMRRTRAATATHCARGHEYTDETTIVRSNGNGRRQCRVCHRIATRAWDERNKEKKRIQRKAREMTS